MDIAPAVFPVAKEVAKIATGHHNDVKTTAAVLRTSAARPRSCVNRNHHSCSTNALGDDTVFGLQQLLRCR